MDTQTIQVVTPTLVTPAGPKFSPQKYRGHTLEILDALADCGGLTTAEIAYKTGLSVHLIAEYCRRGYQRGIFERKESWGWAASPSGLHVLDIATTTTTTTTTTTNHTKTTQQPHKDNTKTTQTPRQLDLSAFQQRDDMDEACLKVVGVLVAHYEKTREKSKYLIFQDHYEMADGLGISFVDLKPTLAHLKQERCIYLRHEHLGWRLGLLVDFVERMQYC
jgi:hypothetical protein